MKNLDELVDSLPEEESKTVDIDISEQIGEAPGTTIFTLREPTAFQIYQAGEDAAKLSGMFPDMTLSMGAVVALLAPSHVSPAVSAKCKDPKGRLYGKLATRNSSVFMHISGSFYQAFPSLKSIKDSIESEKKS